MASGDFRYGRTVFRAMPKVEPWRKRYSGERPHCSLNNLYQRELAALAPTAD